MTHPVQLKLLLLVLITTVYGTKLNPNKKFIEDCCVFGSSLAPNSSCHSTSKFDWLAIPKTLYESCRERIISCCRNQRESNECNEGLELAITETSCKSTSSKTQFCCMACKKGKEVAKRGIECEKVGFEDDPLERGASLKCCEKDKNEIYLHSEEEIDDDEEYNEYQSEFFDTNSTPKPSSIQDKIGGSFETYEAGNVPFDIVIPEYQTITTRTTQSSRAPPSYRNFRTGAVSSPYLASRRNSKNEKDTCGDNLHCEHSCLISGGKQYCTCNKGYVLNSDGHTCRRVDFSSFPPEELRTKCGKGLFLNDLGNCEDINECKIENNGCGDDANCVNRRGTYECIPKSPCRKGFRFNENKRTCEDIDECFEHPSSCNRDQNCNNTFGGFLCTEKYEALQQRICDSSTDVVYPTTTNWNKKLRTTTGQPCFIGLTRTTRTLKTTTPFRSTRPPRTCPTGFEMDSRGMCNDIDECSQPSLNSCRAGTICQNFRGGFYCAPDKCRPGFRREGVECVDINECEERNPCPVTSICMNLHGNWTCKPKYCERGFELNRHTGECEDVDECRQQPDLCRFGDCVNSYGSFRCECLTGYRNVGNVCEDIDECADGSHRCSQLCTNTYGNYRCSCESGFRLAAYDNQTCEDIDECKDNGEKLCVGECENTHGGFKCKCPDGFKKEGDYCMDIDECMENSNNCHQEDDNCHNVPGSYKCVPWMSGIFFFTTVGNCNSQNLHIFTNTSKHFEGRIMSVIAQPESTNVKQAQADDFTLVKLSNGFDLKSLKSIDGPQEIDINLRFVSYSGNYKSKLREVYRIKLFVSKYTPKFRTGQDSLRN